jgi:hypothetical protein
VMSHLGSRALADRSRHYFFARTDWSPAMEHLTSANGSVAASRRVHRIQIAWQPNTCDLTPRRCVR